MKRCILIAFPCQRKAPLEETAVHVVSIRKLDVPVITSVDINDIGVGCTDPDVFFAGPISGIFCVMHSVCVYFYMYPGSITAEQTLK